jgi:hypothetical protein
VNCAWLDQLPESNSSNVELSCTNPPIEVDCSQDFAASSRFLPAIQSFRTTVSCVEAKKHRDNQLARSSLRTGVASDRPSETGSVDGVVVLLLVSFQGICMTCAKNDTFQTEQQLEFSANT